MTDDTESQTEGRARVAAGFPVRCPEYAASDDGKWKKGRIRRREDCKLKEESTRMKNHDNPAEARGAFQTIMRKIPIFGGYLDRQARRESDALLRKWIVERLRKVKDSLHDWNRELVELGDIDQLPKLDKIHAQVERIIARIDGAPAGYGGFFDLIQVDAAVLDDVYENDSQLLDMADEFGKTVEEIARNPDGVQRVSDVLKELETLDEKVDRRHQILSGL